MGVNIETSTDELLNTAQEQIYDTYSVKAWALKLASDAARTVLSVDQIIMSKPAGGMAPKKQAGGWDEDD